MSLRDILTWARFVVVARRENDKLMLWDAYLHGACLMHLDGLGLGTGLAIDDAEGTKTLADAFLSSQLSQEGCRKDATTRLCFSVVEKRFGSDPFWLSTGPQESRNQSFNFEAPTTAMNILRVVRAMQLLKPVLLEGSPGVGKTTLIAALAAASGHNLTRINLSEQTDISDLIGSDLPVPDIDSSGRTHATFRWFDGVLLSAIKNGDWVLLDELNLASQSVLEGLNSCLDHRASVFVPELGRAFGCPPTFRVFAAQNPLAQGGGRKGLPKSFLNRFTKVYVDTLCENDLQLIVASRFPSEAAVEGMLDFNSKVHRAIIEESSFGRSGAPWEFNLRDVFRWCELSSSDCRCDSQKRFRFARDLYFQRFRTLEDREQVQSIYHDVFGVCTVRPSKLRVSGSRFQIGDVVLPRKHFRLSDQYADNGFEVSLPLGLLEPMEAVARCVGMSWPCLLVGPASTRKTSLVNTLADLSNTTVIEIALSSSSDVSELIGCFEQTDALDQFVGFAKSLISLTKEVIVSSHSSSGTERLSSLLLSLQHHLEVTHETVDEALECALQLATGLTFFGSTLEFCSQKSKAARLAETFQSLKTNQQYTERNEAHFAWKDGVLVEAMTQGHWLHLKNANLCPSSVLDRLNPVMEPGGYLLLAECGADETTNSSHRVVRCHPDFRVFLSMNPDYGEVSRAMRNRCVEIAILESGDSDQRQFLDSLDALSRTGLRSAVLASSVLRLPKISGGGSQTCIQAAGSSVSSLLCRGVHGKHVLSTSTRLLCQDEVGIMKLKYLYHEIADGMVRARVSAIPSSPLVKEGWALVPSVAQNLWSSRVLRLFFGWGRLLPSIGDIFAPELSLFDGRTVERDSLSRYSIFLPYLSKNITCTDLRGALLALHLRRENRETLSDSVSFFARLGGSSSKTFRFLADHMATVLDAQRYGGGERSGEDVLWIDQKGTYLSSIHRILLNRLPQLLRERVWLERIQRMGAATEALRLSVLHASYLITEGSIDRSFVDCPLTPVLFSLFGALDRWVHLVLVDSTDIAEATESGLLSSLKSLLDRRDELWALLNDSCFLAENRGYLGFEEGEFIVQWILFGKSLQEVLHLSTLSDSAGMKDCQRRLLVLVESIDGIVFYGVGKDTTGGSSVLKRAIIPMVPRKAQHWLSVSAIRKISRLCCIDRRVLTGNESTPITLQDLVDQRHPLLFTSEKLKKDILAALCTTLLASTDEIASSIPTSLHHSVRDFAKILHSEHVQENDRFLAELASLRFTSNLARTENIMDAGELERFLSGTACIQLTFRRLSAQLLQRFSSIQLAPCVECWCENQESSIIRSLCHILMMKEKGNVRVRVQAMQSLLSRFVSTGAFQNAMGYCRSQTVSDTYLDVRWE